MYKYKIPALVGENRKKRSAKIDIRNVRLETFKIN